MLIPDYRISQLDKSPSGFGKSGTLRVIEHMRYLVSQRNLIATFEFKHKNGKLSIKTSTNGGGRIK